MANDDLDFPKRIIGDQWRDIIAALHFGVPSQEASQLLLRGPIEVAFANGDGTKLSELASAHPYGFWTVLEDTVPAGSQDWNDVAPGDLAKAATALENSGVLEVAGNRPEAVAIRSNIKIASAGVQAWNPFNDETAKGMLAIGKLLGDSEKIIPGLLTGTSNTLVGNPGASEQEGNSRGGGERVTARVWMASALTLMEGVVDLGLDPHQGARIRVPLSDQQWLEVSREVASTDPDGRLLQYFELQAIVEIDQLLAGQIANDQIEGNTFQAAHVALMTASQSGLINTANSLLGRLQSGESIQSGLVNFMLRMLRRSEAGGLIPQDQFAVLAAEGHYLHHLYQATIDSHPGAVGECMFGFLKAVPDAREPDHVGDSQAGYEQLTQLLQNPDTVPGAVDHFAAIVKETGQLPVVFEIVPAGRTVPLFMAGVLSTLLVSEVVYKPAELVRENWGVIREVLEKETPSSFEAFLKELPERDSLVGRIVDGAFDVSESGLYVALVKGISDRSLINWCAAQLSGVGQETWSTQMLSQGDLMDLVIELRSRGANVTLGVAFLDGLIAYAEIVAGGLNGPPEKGYWKGLLSFLSADQQELLSRRAYDILAASDGEPSAEFIAFLGELLSNPRLLSNQWRFIDEVCRPILVKGNLSGIAWMADIAESDPEVLTRHRDRVAANDFRDRVQQRLNDASDDDPTLPNMKRIGAALGIERVERLDSELAPDEESQDVREASG